MDPGSTLGSKPQDSQIQGPRLNPVGSKAPPCLGPLHTLLATWWPRILTWIRVRGAQAWIQDDPGSSPLRCSLLGPGGQLVQAGFPALGGRGQVMCVWGGVLNAPHQQP